jgi:hypothetical protein
MVLSTFKCLGFSLDFMRVSFKFDENFDMLQNFCSYLDDDNSNYTMQWWLGQEWVMSRTGRFFMLRPTNWNYDVARVHFENEVRVDFYSSFFMWSGCWDILRKLYDAPHRIFRVDIAMDLGGLDPSELVNLFSTGLPRTRINDDQTVYIGDWQSNRKLIRMYDKKADSLKKRKTEIFPHVMEFEGNVTRLEVELRNEACKAWSPTIERLCDPEYQYKIFKKELSTRHVFLPLPESMDSWYQKPQLGRRGVPDAVKVLRKAFAIAVRKGLDPVYEAEVFCGRSIS